MGLSYNAGLCSQKRVLQHRPGMHCKRAAPAAGARMVALPCRGGGLRRGARGTVLLGMAYYGRVWCTRAGYPVLVTPGYEVTSSQERACKRGMRQCIAAPPAPLSLARRRSGHYHHALRSRALLPFPGHSLRNGRGWAWLWPRHCFKRAGRRALKTTAVRAARKPPPLTAPPAAHAR